MSSQVTTSDELYSNDEARKLQEAQKQQSLGTSVPTVSPEVSAQVEPNEISPEAEPETDPIGWEFKESEQFTGKPSFYPSAEEMMGLPSLETQESEQQYVVKPAITTGTASEQESHYNTAQIRKLMKEGYTEEALRDIAYDYFPKVHDTFSSGMGKDEIIRKLLEYAKQQRQIPNLLLSLEEENPTRYREFKSFIGKAQRITRDEKLVKFRICKKIT